MIEERRHEIEREIQQKIIASFEEMVKIAKMVGVDISDPTKMQQFHTKQLVNRFMQIHIYFKKRKEFLATTEKSRDWIELKQTKQEVYQLVESCSRFPSRIRFFFNKKKLFSLSNKYGELFQKVGDPTAYAGAWEISDTLESIRPYTLGANRDGIDQTE